ncbi:hypothetical protein SZ55_4108 [Pseudomonas sp. FeS53a]|nr:hypothetical protein SZ55_4108 [Pseudomonas sp. FeS53a]
MCILSGRTGRYLAPIALRRPSRAARAAASMLARPPPRGPPPCTV